MSTSLISTQCTTKPSRLLRLIGLVVINPDHASCPAGDTIPGVLGGWVCSCACHKDTTPTDVAELVTTTKELS